MADVAVNNVFIQRPHVQITITGAIVPPWRHRLAGHAFVETQPMSGFVVAMALDGPTIIGTCEVEPDGSWEIKGISSKYQDTEIIVLGISRTASDNYAIVSRVKTVN